MIPRYAFKEIIKLLKSQFDKEMKFADFMEDYLNGRYVPTLSDNLSKAFQILIFYSVEFGFDDEHNKELTWFDWYMYDCEFGENPSKASFDNKEYLIDSDDTFYDMLIDWEKHQLAVFEQYVHHNKKMWVRKLLKGKHKDNCLCYDCALFKPDSEDNCKIAQEIYKMNFLLGAVTPVHECINFNEREHYDKK